MIDVLYVVFASISIFLVVVPSPWHVAAWNSATCYLMLWTTIGCIIHLVNSVVWAGNIENSAPIYCDISTKLSMGLSIAIPLSSLCINRRLYNIATISSVAVTKGQKRRDVLIDTLLAVLGPIVFMAVHYTMQGHRYDIIENYGCWPSTYLTAPAYVLVIAPPVFVCSVSLCYAMFSLRAFIRRRTEFSQLLKTSSTGLNSGRYFRLMALASSEVVIGLPTSLYFLITDLKTVGVAPWVSWEDTHFNFGHINYFPSYFFKFNRATQVAIELNRWTFPFIAILFFGFFGLGDEAKKNYRRAFYAILKPFGVTPAPSSSSSWPSTHSKFSEKSKGCPIPHDDDTAIVLSLPPQYVYPSTPTSSSRLHVATDLTPSTADFDPTVHRDMFDVRHSGSPATSSADSTSDLHAPTPPRPNTPSYPSFSRPSASRLDHVTTATHISSDNNV